MGLANLDHKTGAGLHVLVATVSEACAQLREWQCSAPSQRLARVIRGDKCRTQTSLFDEFAAAWQFPHYFGENWDAFEECLADLDWLPASAYLLLVSNAAQVLEKESDPQRTVFWQVLERTIRSWSQTRRPPVAIHVVAQTISPELDNLRRGLEAAKVVYDVLR